MVDETIPLIFGNAQGLCSGSLRGCQVEPSQGFDEILRGDVPCEGGVAQGVLGGGLIGARERLEGLIAFVRAGVGPLGVGGAD